MSNDEHSEEAVRKQAFAWYARLCSGEATAADQAAWQQWHGTHPTHARVWQRLETIRSTVQRVPSAIAAPSLRAVNRDRRNTLRGIALLAAGGVVAGVSWKLVADDGGWRSVLAEHRTGTGEQREVELADGSRMLLNTRSAVDIDLNASRRTVRLRAGEIQIETAKHAGRPVDTRPFVVNTLHGSVRALGTRFIVRVEDERSTVTVLQDAVEVRALNAPKRPQRLDAGKRLSLTQNTVERPEAADPAAGEWAHGSLVVSHWRLADLLAELSRYRPGRLACAPEVADLRVSGAYPVLDTDKALSVLARSLPVRIVSATRYWVMVESR
jgi:transmembrane sensor